MRGVQLSLRSSPRRCSRGSASSGWPGCSVAWASRWCSPAWRGGCCARLPCRRSRACRWPAGLPLPRESPARRCPLRHPRRRSRRAPPSCWSTSPVPSGRRASTNYGPVSASPTPSTPPAGRWPTPTRTPSTLPHRWLTATASRCRRLARRRPRQGTATPDRRRTPAVAAPVDVNTATAAELETLPGIGPATAAAIVEHREQNGPFASVDDLDEVPGIGTAKLDAIRDLVRV